MSDDLPPNVVHAEFSKHGDEREPDLSYGPRRPMRKRLLFALKVVAVLAGFWTSFAALWYGIVYLVFAPGLEKLWGLPLMAGAGALAVLSMWIALDRPRHWFAPGVNVEPIPGRRTPTEALRDGFRSMTRR